MKELRERDLPAFAQSMAMSDDEGWSLPEFEGDFKYSGMTKLQHTAVQMMQAAGHPQLGGVDGNFEHCAKNAVKAANALWDELEKQSCGN